MIKVMGFDMGGTLMEYAEMPHNWSERYYQCFKATAENLKIQVTDFEITRSVDILKSYRFPRHPR